MNLEQPSEILGRVLYNSNVCPYVYTTVTEIILLMFCSFVYFLYFFIKYKKAVLIQEGIVVEIKQILPWNEY